MIEEHTPNYIFTLIDCQRVKVSLKVSEPGKKVTIINYSGFVNHQYEERKKCVNLMGGVCAFSDTAGSEWLHNGH
jgi:hypothetical protein